MITSRLEKRRNKVSKFLSYMLEDKNDYKISQCTRIFSLINEAYERMINNKQDKLNQIKNGKIN